MALSVYLEVHSIQDVQYILCLITYLYDNGLAPSSITGYLAAVKHAFVYYGLNVAVFDNKLIPLLLKSITLNAPLRIREKGIIDIELLEKIVDACRYLKYPLLYKSIFFTAFYTFLRISNFAPTAFLEFDTTRHLTRGDIVWGPPGAQLIVKWAKNMQKHSDCHVIHIPLIKNKNICPVLNLQTLFKLFPAPYSSPMFFDPITKKPLIQSNIRQALSVILQILKIPPGFITFHSFRRSGATFAFNHSVNIQNIQAHGAWRSQAIWTYLTKAQGTARVASAFRETHPLTTPTFLGLVF